MRKTTTKANRSYSLDPDVIVAVERSKGPHSASERVNRLLRTALDLERKAKLTAAAAAFFREDRDEEVERHAFQKAGLRSLIRE